MPESKKINILIRVFFLFIIILIIISLFFFKPIQKENSTKYFFNNLLNIISNNKNLFNHEKDSAEIYFVQLGIFAKDNEVDKIRAKTKILNLNPSFEKKFYKGKLVTKITLGPYNSMSLNRTISILEDNNIQYFIINE